MAVTHLLPDSVALIVTSTPHHRTALSCRRRRYQRLRFNLNPLLPTPPLWRTSSRPTARPTRSLRPQVPTHSAPIRPNPKLNRSSLETMTLGSRPEALSQPRPQREIRFSVWHPLPPSPRRRPCPLRLLLPLPVSQSTWLSPSMTIRYCSYAPPNPPLFMGIRYLLSTLPLKICGSFK